MFNPELEPRKRTKTTKSSSQYEYYDLNFKMTVTIKCKPENVGKRHDIMAKRFVKALEKEFGKRQYVKDCKTGRFRKL